MDINIGDEVIFTPHDKRYDKVKGFVAEEIKNQSNEPGYHILSPLPGDTGRIVRIWLNEGIISKTGKVVEKPKESVAAKATSSPEKPYRNAGDLASDYKKQGMNRQTAWNQFVIDTVLQPRYRSENLDAKDFYKLFDGA